MRISTSWIVDLPLNFAIGNGFKQTELNRFIFAINDVNIELLKNQEKQNIDRAKIELIDEYDEAYMPMNEHLEKYSSFLDHITFKAGSALQGFLDGFSKHTNNRYYQVFDGEQFITNHSFSIFSGTSTRKRNRLRSPYLDDETIKKSIDFACRKKNVLDYAWYMLRDAEHSADLGKYEMSIIYMATTIELLVTSALSNYLDENGEFKKIHKKKIESLYGKKTSFVNRYFDYGLTLITDKKLEDGIIEGINFIYRLRNRLAHGKLFLDIDLIKENGIDVYNIRNYCNQLIICIDEVYNFFYELNEESKIFVLKD